MVFLFVISRVRFLIFILLFCFIGTSSYANSGASYSAGKTRKVQLSEKQGIEKNIPGAKDHFTKISLLKIRSVRTEESESAETNYAAYVSGFSGSAASQVSLLGMSSKTWISDLLLALLYPKHHFW
jgi:hypothetical protein